MTEYLKTFNPLKQWPITARTALHGLRLSVPESQARTLEHRVRAWLHVRHASHSAEEKDEISSLTKSGEQHPSGLCTSETCCSLEAERREEIFPINESFWLFLVPSTGILFQSGSWIIAVARFCLTEAPPTSPLLALSPVWHLRNKHPAAIWVDEKSIDADCFIKQLSFLRARKKNKKTQHA